MLSAVLLLQSPLPTEDIGIRISEELMGNGTFNILHTSYVYVILFINRMTKRTIKNNVLLCTIYCVICCQFFLNVYQFTIKDISMAMGDSQMKGWTGQGELSEPGTSTCSAIQKLPCVLYVQCQNIVSIIVYNINSMIL